MSQEMNRRDFIKDSLLTTAGALALGSTAAAAAEAAKPAPGAPEIAETLPQGKIGGSLSVSRMIIGGNLLTLHTHSRDLGYVHDLVEHYNTDEKILETLALAEQHGINTISVSNPPRVMDILKKHRARGGKLQWIICLNAPIEEDMATYKAEARKLAIEGADAIYLHGAVSDALVAKGRIDLIAKAVELVKELEVPSGVGGHDINVVMECEKAKIPNDFYIKTLHHHNYPSHPHPEELIKPLTEVPGYWCKDPAALIELMKGVTKPWIAFKIMAAGAIHPKNAFQWAFENGADHILVGMFDWQIKEDILIARDALAKAKRTRPWRS